MLHPLGSPWRWVKERTVNLSRLGNLPRTQLNKRNDLPGLAVRVSGGTDQGVDVTCALDSQDLEAWAEDPSLLAADHFFIEVRGQTARLVLMHCADVGPAADPLTRLRPVHDQVLRSHLTLSASGTERPAAHQTAAPAECREAWWSYLLRH